MQASKAIPKKDAHLLRCLSKGHEASPSVSRVNTASICKKKPKKPHLLG
jgi:hypothetical protein